jgi:hypothetical protein
LGALLNKKTFMAKILSKIIKTLIISDFFLNLGWGLLSPVFALFLLSNVANLDPAKAAEVAGLSALFYWITKSLLQVPIGILLDKKGGEKDDFWVMFLGTLLAASVPIGYLFSTAPWHIYFWQIIYALGMAMALPSWLAIFTRHVDKGQEAFEWGLESTSIGLGAGIAGGLGGIVSTYFGFPILFISVTVLNLISAFCLLAVRNKVFLRRDGVSAIMDKPTIVP